MTFHSILARPGDSAARETSQAPAFFGDLNLDQIIDAVTAGREEYNLKPYFYTSLRDIDAIKYRQEVFRDMGNRNVFECIRAFAKRMRVMRKHLAQMEKLSVKYQRERWFVAAVDVYCEAVNCLASDLTIVELQSRGLLGLRKYIADYVKSGRFTSLLMETQNVIDALSTAKYCVLIKGKTIRVCKYEAENDYSLEIEATFAKFKQGAVKDYQVDFLTGPHMNHVEEKILDLVARLYPDIFLDLDNYCAKNSQYLEDTIGIFDREIQFYVAFMEYIGELKRTGLSFCLPRIADNCKEVYNYEGFDLALAHGLAKLNSSVVSNDFCLRDPERILVVSGPNQGGKTTFARAFGQLHYLAGTGCPVPGREAQLFLFDGLFTHFEKEENMKNLRGKLQDDLVRIHDILNRITTNSIVIMNEIFTSTTLQDAVFLGKKVIERILELDCLCVCVTFIDELASLSEKTVSMVSTVVPDNPSRRTFKIVRRAADGLSYAISIAEKHRVTYDQLKGRLKL